MSLDFFNLEDHQIREADRNLEAEVKSAVIDCVLWTILIGSLLVVFSLMGPE